MIADISQVKLHSEFFAELVKAYSPIKELKDGVVYVKTKNESNWNAEVCKVKDSFANCMLPFHAEDFEKIVVVDLRQLNIGCDALMDMFTPTDVLVLYNSAQFAADRDFAMKCS